MLKNKRKREVLISGKKSIVIVINSNHVTEFVTNEINSLME